MARIFLRIQFHGFGLDTDREILADTDTDSDQVLADRIGHGSKILSIRTPLPKKPSLTYIVLKKLQILY